jgi:prepilin-type processing-associated H-X9-DG protein
LAVEKVELLVVVVLGVIALALLLPATCKVRQAGARVQCMNNLKQLAIGLHNYASNTPGAAPGREAPPLLPAGTVPNAALPPERRLSWFVELLPYIEQDTLFGQIDRQASWDARANADAVGAPLKGLLCPASLGEPAAQATNVTNYVGLAGLGLDAASQPNGHPGIGLFGYDRRADLSKIKDGLANTALILETARENGPWARGGPATVRGLDTGDRPYVGVGRAFGGLHFSEATIFRGRRSLGCNVAMADGSVRLLKDSAAPEVLEALVTVAGGEKIDESWYMN